MKTAIILAITSLILMGCDTRECVRGHWERQWYTMPVLVSITNNMPNYIYVPTEGDFYICDAYKAKQ